MAWWETLLGNKRVIPTYNAHSFESKELGAWVVSGLRYIHAGPPYGYLCGSNGCTEIMGEGKFTSFNNLIFNLSGLGNSGKTASQMMIEIAKAQTLTVIFDQSVKPPIIKI